MSYFVQFGEINARAKVKVQLPDSYKAEGLIGDLVKMVAPVLIYNRSYLERDGFVSVWMLEDIYRRLGERYCIFSSPKDWEENRCHLIFPCAIAAKHNLVILDWEIKKWTNTTLVKPKN